VTDTPANVNIFKQDKSWDLPIAKESACDVYVIVGPSNCGKSTFAGYLLNQLVDLKTGEKDGIYYLECDAGQPHFTLPGQLSLL